MIRNDYMMRQIKKLSEAIARIAGLARSGKADEALRELDAQYGPLLGLPRSTLDRLDARSALMLVGSDKAELLIQLIEAEADVLGVLGHEGEAAKRAARAEAIRRQLGA